LENNPILSGDLILAEVLQGFRHDPDFEKIHRILGKFMQESMVNSVLAVESARSYRFLRQKGIRVCKTMDSLIATFCIENDHQLLHNDSDFDGYEEYLGLRVVHP
jgi:predicted nucleic acid-binding protein